jgi:hypothetical protein
MSKKISTQMQINLMNIKSKLKDIISGLNGMIFRLV